MRKRFLSLILCVGALFVCLFFASCEKEEEMTVYTIRTVGTFSGHRVDYVRREWKDADVVTVVVEYRIDGIYIFTLPSPAYAYMVDVDGKEQKNLSVAYEEGLVTRDDLVAIAEAEKPFDVCRDETAGEAA